MAKATLIRKGGIVARYDFTRLPPKLTIGSDPFDIIYIYDDKIFKRHLLLEQVNDRYFIENLHDAQGALINGRILDQKVELHDGDQISLGDHTLIFSGIGVIKAVRAEDAVPYPATPDETVVEIKPVVNEAEQRRLPDQEAIVTSDDTIVLSDEAPSAIEPATPVETAPTKILEVFPPAYDLLVIHGPYTGNSYPLNPDSTRIGRDQNFNDIVIRETKKGAIDYTISRRHATITVKNGRYYLMDNNSKNGTFLNQEKLGEHDERLLKDGDEIELASESASTIFRFVPAGYQDLSPPKSGVKKRSRLSRAIATGVSIIIIATGMMLFKISYTQRSAILEKPGFLTATAKQLSANELFGSRQLWVPKVANLMQLMPTPLLVKLDGAGTVLLILLDPEGYPLAWDFKTSRVVWSIRNSGQTGSDFSVTGVDLNGDGLLEMLLSGRDSRVYAYDCRLGTQIWKSDFLGGRLASQPSVGDLNGDGLNDVVVCSEHGLIHCGIASAQHINWINKKFDNKTKAIPAVVDIDGDGLAEILVGTEAGIVFIFAVKDQEVIIKRHYDIQKASSIFINNSINNAIAFGRLSGRQRESALVISARQYGVISVDPASFELLWSDKLTDPYRPLPLYHSSPLCGDINADDRLEAVLASHNGEIVLYAATRNDTPGKADRLWTFKSEPGTAFFATPALADLNKDGKLDLVACDTLGTLYLIDSNNGENLHEPLKSKASFSASPLVGDVNGDGYLDIVAVDNSYNIHLYQLNTRVAQHSISWSQYAGSANHTGQFFNRPVTISNYNLKFYLSIAIILAGLGFIIRRWRRV